MRGKKVLTTLVLGLSLIGGFAGAVPGAHAAPRASHGTVRRMPSEPSDIVICFAPKKCVTLHF